MRFVHIKQFGKGKPNAFLQNFLKNCFWYSQGKREKRKNPSTATVTKVTIVHAIFLLSSFSLPLFTPYKYWLFSLFSSESMMRKSRKEEDIVNLLPSSFLSYFQPLSKLVNTGFMGAFEGIREGEERIQKASYGSRGWLSYFAIVAAMIDFTSNFEYNLR